MTDKCHCPHCGEEINAALVAKLSASQEMSIKLVPGKDALLQAGTLAATIGEFAAALKANAEPHGVKSEVLVKRIETGEDGSITLTVLMLAIRDGKVDR
jgi:hypothetical protein